MIYLLSVVVLMYKHRCLPSRIISLSFVSSGHVLGEIRGMIFLFLISSRYNLDSFASSTLHFVSNNNFSCSFNVLRHTGAILMSTFISKGMKFFASTTLSPSADFTSCFFETKKLAKFDAAFCFLRSASNFSSSFFLFSSSLASSRFLRSSSFASFSFCFCLQK